MIVWPENVNFSDHDIRGRFIDLSSASAGSIFSVSTSNISEQLNPKIVSDSTSSNALVMWQSHDNGVDHDLRGRFYDLDEAISISSQDFLVSVSNRGVQREHALAVRNDRLYLTWESNDSGTDFDIRSRFLVLNSDIIYNPTANPNFNPKYGLNNFFTAPLIERDYSVSARIK